MQLRVEAAWYLGLCELQAKRTQAMHDYLKTALHMAQAAGLRWHQTGVYLAYTKVYWLYGEVQQAEAYALQALALALELHHADHTARALFGLALARTTRSVSNTPPTPTLVRAKLEAALSSLGWPDLHFMRPRLKVIEQAAAYYRAGAGDVPLVDHLLKVLPEALSDL